MKMAAKEKKIIQLKNARLCFPIKTTKIRREDIIKLLSNKKLNSNETKELEKLVIAMDRGDVAHEYLVVRKKNKCILVPFDED